VPRTIQKLLPIPRVARRWGLSRATLIRLINRGDLKSVTIGARRFIHVAEVERAESGGVGTPRKRSCPNRHSA
jgi:predicted DNA-binding transcriptional regulator AlpA